MLHGGVPRHTPDRDRLCAGTEARPVAARATGRAGAVTVMPSHVRLAGSLASGAGFEGRSPALVVLLAR